MQIQHTNINIPGFRYIFNASFEYRHIYNTLCMLGVTAFSGAENHNYFKTVAGRDPGTIKEIAEVPHFSTSHIDGLSIVFLNF